MRPPNHMPLEGAERNTDRIAGTVNNLRHLLAQSGLAIDVKTTSGWTPLHMAIVADSAYGRKAVVALLLGHPIQVDAVEDADGNLTTLTAVELAARHGHAEIVSMLLDSGARPGPPAGGQAAVVSMLLDQQRPGLDGSWRDHRGFTALDCTLNRDRGDMVAILLSKEQNPQHPATLLHAMVRLSCGSILAMLLAQRKYAKEINTTDANRWSPLYMTATRGSTPLQLAVRYGQTQIVAALLQVVRWEECQSPISPTITEGLTPIHIGVRSGEMDIIRLLLRDRWPVDARCSRGSTALHCASMSDQQDALRLLLQQGADPLVRDQEQMTPLLLAAEAGNVQVMQQLLLREKNIQRHLPALAARKLPPAYEQILVPFLLNKGCNNLSELVDGLTVLHQAAQSGYTIIVKFMLRSSAKVSVKDREGYTPAEVAATQGHFNLVYILDPEPLLQVERLIHHAVRKRNVEQVYKLLTAAPKTLRKRAKAMVMAATALTHQKSLNTTLTRGISIDEDQGWGWRPLYVATLKGEQRAMQLLLTHGANPNLKTNAGITPLLQAAEGGVAARCGHEATVVALLEAGANAHAPDTSGQTALDLALDQGAKNIVQSITEFLAQREKKQ
ncbi:ankyrin repeat-containing domain protein [Aspergillus caelatus]|uniref:Ankyrin repeat-containing domain protein n=1 Tax=Aspergillus caelatus TaxID=61420 RepID=A0A5N7ACF1_9EURO|nr:ankyrin repeat-containing domain protein [Aspergillus caelatus]KAE8367502.1 ankyrin repeat-containing domain protein [Aspergillus caelatus]